MRRFLAGTTLFGALVLGAGVAASAAPPPSNPNYATFTADCRGDEIGFFTVVTTENGAQAFDTNGRPLVLKGIQGFDDATLMVGDLSLPVGGSFGFMKNGKGYEERLVDCDFVEEFTDVFRFTKRDARFLGEFIPEIDWAQYVGETATVTGTATGTAWVLRPGS